MNKLLVKLGLKKPEEKKIEQPTSKTTVELMEEGKHECACGGNCGCNH